MSDFDSFLKKMMGETEPKEKESLETTPLPKIIDKPVRKKQIIEKSKEIIVERDDDIVERSLEYAATFSKIVKKNFPNKADRSVVLESVRNAINLILGNNSTVTATSVVDSPIVDRSVTKKNTPITENSQEEDPYEVLKRAQTSNLPENFNPNIATENDLNIKISHDESGKVEVNLSEMTDADIYSLRVLSGIESTPKQEVVNE